MTTGISVPSDIGDAGAGLDDSNKTSKLRTCLSQIVSASNSLDARASVNESVTSGSAVVSLTTRVSVEESSRTSAGVSLAAVDSTNLSSLGSSVLSLTTRLSTEESTRLSTTTSLNTRISTAESVEAAIH